MAQDNIAFVDQISDTANIRLSLSVAPWSVLKTGTDLPPPPFKRAVVSTLLTDGAKIPAAAYDNRVIVLHVQLDATSPSIAATQLQALNRELDRPYNVLRWQPEPAIPAVYFNTFRSPDWAPENIDHGINLYDFTISLVAEPFAYGTQEQSPSTITVNNDPAAGTNGKFFDISGVKGDVETPLMLKLGGGIANQQTVFALRRGGNVANVPHYYQAESVTLQTNTAVQANSSTYSGTGSNSVVTTFATNNDLTSLRVYTATHPNTASVDARGVYRVWARVNGTVNGDNFTLTLNHGRRIIPNAFKTFTINDINFPEMVDLGLVQIPEGFDPVNFGPTQSELSVAGIRMAFYVKRNSGSGNLIWDYIMLTPADDKFCLVNWGNTVVTSFILDGYNRCVYALNASGQMQDNGNSYYTGDIPVVSPGMTNRIFVIRDVSAAPTVSDLPSGTCTLDYYYWPRYLYVRPLTT